MSQSAQVMQASDFEPPKAVRNEDGVFHINVWSKGRTELGQMLSNFTHMPFEHPEYGTFASMEGFWYWVKTGMEHSILHRAYGASAKSIGQKLSTVMLPDEEFKRIIREGLRLKIVQNQQLREIFIRSYLPFLHYFVYGRNNETIVQKKEHNWQMEYLTELRDELRKEVGLPPAHVALYNSKVNAAAK